MCVCVLLGIGCLRLVLIVFKYDFVQGSVVNKIYKADLQFDLVQEKIH